MKRTILVLVFGLIFIIGCMSSSNSKSELLCCSEDIDSIKAEIKNTYKADSVVLYTKKINEEIYFSEINCPVILIYNATTNVLDFKTLPTSYYQRFEDFEQIENELKKEGIPTALGLIKRCNMSEFNDLIIEFIKKGDDEKTLYRFICHYKELL